MQPAEPAATSNIITWHSWCIFVIWYPVLVGWVDALWIFPGLSVHCGLWLCIAYWWLAALASNSLSSLESSQTDTALVKTHNLEYMIGKNQCLSPYLLFKARTDWYFFLIFQMCNRDECCLPYNTYSINHFSPLICLNTDHIQLYVQLSKEGSWFFIDLFCHCRITIVPVTDRL